ncbi:MAG: hypothetical protein ACRCV9_07100 [Burkholderiaceae bacterium]
MNEQITSTLAKLSTSPLVELGAKTTVVSGGVAASGWLREIESWLSFGAAAFSFALGAFWVGQLIFTVTRRYRATGRIFKVEK